MNTETEDKIENGVAEHALTSPTLPPPEQALGPLALKVAQLVIADKDSHLAGLALGRRITGMQRFVEGLYADHKKKAFDLHKSIVGAEKKYLIPISNALSLLNSKINTYERAERERAEKEARERQALAKKQDEERALEEAVAADEAGDSELAEQLLEVPVVAPPVVPEPQLAHMDGVSSRGSYGAEILNFEALVQYVSKNPDQLHLLLPNQVALNGIARALKDKMRIPGVRAVPKTTRSFGSDE